MTKILVADDEADLEILIRQKFRKKIRNKLYEFVFAVNGQDALNKIKEHPDIAIVLSDINMPEMDGLTFLTKLNEVAPLTKAVMVSAYGDMDNIRTAMNRGAFDFVTKPVNFDDLELTMEKTIRHVTQMRETLQAIKENNILKMYVDANVLNFMGTREYETALTANETIEASVVFIDICNFTSISEKETPDTVVKMLNQYFEVMVKEILDQEGLIDKFMGDSVMALFKGEGHLERAVNACLAVRGKIQSIKEPVKGKPEYASRVSIGINTGEMISGNIGSASLKRLDYTVIGDVVNLAQRLQTAATPGQILITEPNYQKIKDVFGCQNVGQVKVKNKAEPLEVYEVLS